jgi:hypothetical protein
MPCNSDYLSDTPAETATRRVAGHLAYLKLSLGQEVSAQIKRDISFKDYPNTDHLNEYVVELCTILGGLTEDQLNHIVYDGKNPKARDLANWWDYHKQADAERIAKEEAEARRKELRKSAFRKLTQAERDALEL